jgi:hypothetical protein
MPWILFLGLQLVDERLKRVQGRDAAQTEGIFKAVKVTDFLGSARCRDAQMGGRVETVCQIKLDL